MNEVRDNQPTGAERAGGVAVGEDRGDTWKRAHWPLRVGAYVAVAIVLVTVYRVDLLPGMADALLEYFLYMACATTITPLPTIPSILYAATQAPAVAVAVVGALGTVVAYLIEYGLFSQLLRLGYVNKLRSSRVYEWLAGVFRSAPFVALTIAAFLPLPVDGVRLLSIGERYHRGKYALAAFLGRVPRYWIIAAWGRSMTWSWSLVGIVALVIGLLGAIRWLWSRHQTVSTLVVAVGMAASAGFAVLAGSLAGALAGEPPALPPVETSQRLDGVLRRFDDAVARVDDVHARFVQSRYSPVFDDTETNAGELWYRTPGDLTLHYAEPEQQVYIDAEGVWMYLVAQKQAQRYPFATAAERDASLAMLWRPSAQLTERYDIAVADTLPVGEADGEWLVLTPRDAELASVVATLYLRIDRRLDLSDCIVVERTDGERVRLEVTELDVNPGIDPSRFAFVPPPGTDVQRFDATPGGE